VCRPEAKVNTKPSNKAVRVSVVIPTWNERENVRPLLSRLAGVLAGRDYRLIVVDDGSPDGTADMVREYQERNSRVVLIQREGKSGLASAVLKGAEACDSDFVVMMDADFSHEPEAVPSLIDKLAQRYDVVVGSRYVQGAKLIGWPLFRRLISWGATAIARTLLRAGARDPLSGFAAFKRKVLLDLPTRYSAREFKLLLEVLVTKAPLKVAEVPITFTEREKGASKMGTGELLGFLTLCFKLLGWKLSQPFRDTCRR